MSDEVPPELEIEALVQQGILAYRAGDRRRARQLLTAATKREPRHEQAWLWLSAAHDDVEFKRICLNKVLALNPRHPQARRGLALLDGQTTKPASVFSAPDTAPPATSPPAPRPLATLRARPVAPPAPSCPWCQAEFTAGHTLSGRCPRCGRPLEVDCPQCEQRVPVTQSACPHCAHAFGQLHADREGYLARLSAAYQAKGWVDQALPLVEDLLTLAPRNARYQQRAAQLYDQLGDTPRSINAYRAVLDLEPGQVEALAYLTRWYLTLHQTPELREMGQKLRALKQRSTRLTLLLGDVAYELDQLKEAERVYADLLRGAELDPAVRARLHLRRGEIQREQGQLLRAVKEYEASVTAGVDNEAAQAARRRLNELRPPLPPYALTSYGETLRAMAGPLILLGLLTGMQTALDPQRLTLAAALGVVLGVLGSYLLACAQVTPQTLEWRALLGEAGLAHPLARPLVSVFGGGLLLWALVLVLFGS